MVLPSAQDVQLGAGGAIAGVCSAHAASGPSTRSSKSRTMAALSKRERLMTEPGPSSGSRASGARSRVADATAAVAGGVVGAAVKGVIGGIQGTVDGIREGWRKGSQSVAGRPGEAWVKGVIGGVQGAAKGIRDGWSMRGQFRRRTR